MIPFQPCSFVVFTIWWNWPPEVEIFWVITLWSNKILFVCDWEETFLRCFFLLLSTALHFGPLDQIAGQKSISHKLYSWVSWQGKLKNQQRKDYLLKSVCVCEREREILRVYEYERVCVREREIETSDPLQFISKDSK